ncbi:Crp/Fnr family transcriptional regulator [Acidovorax cavernicola]|uniref:Crp/Fnr family transcriptional regulator n=1 Tax=Acidovorax cavernicola TaxID=1675792 RepID=A0A9X8D5W5_9BURK|nr:Crp/Fnr family transcriptional regulator [Acidovorax cavernicola]RIX80639.1 Crp/Fnr family transcriptional regulator [Acidovorax cavernicola]
MPVTKPAPPAASQTIAQLLQGSAWFPRLDVSAGERVLDEMREVEVAAGAALCRCGDTPLHWYGTIEGLLKWCVTSPDGRSVTLGGLSAGSWFGEGTLLRGVPRTADIIALRPSRVALMPLETFAWLRATHRSFDDFLLRQINERMHWFLGNFTAHHLLDTDSQVARALAGLFHEWLHPGSDPHLQVSQEEIANLSGLSRQRCNAALRRLASAGLLRIEYGGITVTDLDGLRRRLDG